MLCVMMVDIDYFKRYNDTYGHMEGDNCLKKIAKVLHDNMYRADDFVARYGGEEFVVVLPNTNETGASLMAARLMESIRNCRIPHKNSDVSEYVTVSIGVVTGMVEYSHSIDTYIKRADELLYESKQSGRNRFICEGL